MCVCVCVCVRACVCVRSCVRACVRSFVQCAWQTVYRFRMIRVMAHQVVMVASPVVGAVTRVTPTSASVPL